MIETDKQEEMVKMSKKEFMELAQKLCGFQNISLVLHEKDFELKRMKQKCQLYESKLVEMQKLVTEKPKTGEPDWRPSLQSKNSDPEVFLFPDSQNQTQPHTNGTSRLSSLQSRSLEMDGRLESSQSNMLLHSAGQRSVGSTRGGYSMTQEGRVPQDEAVPQISLPDNLVQLASTRGVSEHYFTNVVNELVRTKKHLHNIQKLKSEGTQGSSSEVEKLRSELYQVRRQCQDMEEQLQGMVEKQAVARREEKSGDDDSLEISSLEQSSCFTDSATQTESTDNHKTEHSGMMAVERELTSQIEKLTQENKALGQLAEELKKRNQGELEAEMTAVMEEKEALQGELDQQKASFVGLENGVKILSKCLTEEKNRSRQREMSWKAEREENISTKTKLSEQIAHLRQENETLREEKRALEKLKDLCVPSTPQVAHRHSSSSVHSGSRLSDRPPSGSSSRMTAYDIPGTLFTGGTSSQDRVCGPNRAPVSITGTEETEDHQSFQCPRCLLAFQLEQTYMQHLEKCIE